VNAKRHMCRVKYSWEYGYFELNYQALVEDSLFDYCGLTGVDLSSLLCIKKDSTLLPIPLTPRRGAGKTCGILID
jgi:hypothetical protein